MRLKKPLGIFTAIALSCGLLFGQGTATTGGGGGTNPKQISTTTLTNTLSGFYLRKDVSDTKTGDLFLTNGNLNIQGTNFGRIVFPVNREEAAVPGGFTNVIGMEFNFQDGGRAVYGATGMTPASPITNNWIKEVMVSADDYYFSRWIQGSRPVGSSTNSILHFEYGPLTSATKQEYDFITVRHGNNFIQTMLVAGTNVTQNFLRLGQAANGTGSLDLYLTLRSTNVFIVSPVNDVFIMAMQANSYLRMESGSILDVVSGGRIDIADHFNMKDGAFLTVNRRAKTADFTLSNGDMYSAMFPTAAVINVTEQNANTGNGRMHIFNIEQAGHTVNIAPLNASQTIGYSTNFVMTDWAILTSNGGTNWSVMAPKRVFQESLPKKSPIEWHGVVTVSGGAGQSLISPVDQRGTPIFRNIYTVIPVPHQATATGAGGYESKLLNFGLNGTNITILTTVGGAHAADGVSNRVMIVGDSN